MRIFISSTVFDLIDARAELAAQLRSLGIVPVLSDDKLTDFRVKPDVNSIETCLVNVAACDEVIVILDRRYGPRLGDFGYENISATHLEYRRAMELGRPVHVYVRDRLNAEYSIWKRNGRSDSVALNWVKKNDVGLFELLDEHSSLKADSDKSNWYFSFSNSLDLKAAAAKQLESKILPRRLVEAIQNNAFPLFDINLNVEQEQIGFSSALKFSTTLQNVSGSPAFNFRVYWEGKDKDTTRKTIVSPRQSVLMTQLFSYGTEHPEIESFLIAEYESPMGISVYDRYRVHGHIAHSVLISGGKLVDRKFRRVSNLSIEIEDT